MVALTITQASQAAAACKARCLSDGLMLHVPGPFTRLLNLLVVMARDVAASLNGF